MSSPTEEEETNQKPKEENPSSVVDSAYTYYKFVPPSLPHSYGENVHLSSDPILLTELAELSAKTTHQPRITELVRDLYKSLLRTVLSKELPTTQTQIETRMHDLNPNRGVWRGRV